MQRIIDMKVSEFYYLT